MSKINILVVDDEESMRTILKDILVEQGYDVDTAENGAVGVEKFRDKHFDLIISDVHMPVMNGFEFVKTVAQDNPKVKILMLDSYPDELLEKALESGALTCLHKPFRIIRLL